MTFVDAIRSGLNNFVNFRGVASRPAYWYFYLFTFLVGLVTSTFDGVLGAAGVLVDESGTSVGALNGLTSLALLLPSLSVTARRMRDAGYSQKWWLINLVPFVLFIVALVQLISSKEAWDLISKLSAATGDLSGFDEGYAAFLLNGLVAILIYFLPSILAAIGVSIFWLIMLLKPTKTYEQGNKYVRPADFSAPVQPSQPTDY